MDNNENNLKKNDFSLKEIKDDTKFFILNLNKNVGHSVAEKLDNYLIEKIWVFLI